MGPPLQATGYREVGQQDSQRRRLTGGRGTRSAYVLKIIMCRGKLVAAGRTYYTRIPNGVGHVQVFLQPGQACVGYVDAIEVASFGEQDDTGAGFEHLTS